MEFLHSSVEMTHSCINKTGLKHSKCALPLERNLHTCPRTLKNRNARHELDEAAEKGGMRSMDFVEMEAKTPGKNQGISIFAVNVLMSFFKCL